MTTLEQIGQRLYLVGLPFASKDAAKAALGMTGANFDRDRKRWFVGLAKREAAQKFVDGLNGGGQQGSEPHAEDVSKCRAYASVEYKGRRYIQIGRTQDGTRLRLCTMGEGGPTFWADSSLCQVVKVYQTREFRGREEYQTVGSLRRFVAKQQRAKEAGEPACPECGKRGALIEDLEDGLMKCYGCCDMPSE